MGKKPTPTDEEMLGYMRAGWHMHKKIVKKKYEYIVRRQGQVTRSLGPFTEEFWSRIHNLEHRLALEEEGLLKQSEPIEDTTSEMRREAHKRIKKARENTTKHLNGWRGMVKSTDCIYIKEDYCYYWLWEQRMPFFTSIQETKLPGSEFVREHFTDNNMKCWVVKADVDYCVHCNAHEPREKRESVAVLSEIQNYFK